MKSFNSSDVDINELTNLTFILGYFHHYRYLRSKILESDLDRLEEVLPDLKEEQLESVATMLQVELIVNAVMYCQDLAAILLALNKPPSEILKMVSSLHETGSGSIKEFYERLPSREFEYFWRLIKYDKLQLMDHSEKEKHERSCKRFKSDMLKLSKFFLYWYGLFSVYKHGLNVVALRDAKTTKDVLLLGNQDGSFDILVLSPSWYLGYIETVEIVFRIFDRLIEPIFWKILQHVAQVDLEEQRTIRKTLLSKKPEEESRPYKLSMKVRFPWKVREAKKPTPFY